MTAASLGALVTQSFVRNKARTASVLGLWILGFLIMNYLPAPYEVSPEMRREYNRIVTEEGRQDDVSMESIYFKNCIDLIYVPTVAECQYINEFIMTV